MEKKLISIGIIIVAVLFGIGAALFIGDNLFEPIKDIIGYDGSIRTSRVELISYKIFKVAGILTIWGVGTFFTKFIIEEFVYTRY